MNGETHFQLKLLTGLFVGVLLVTVISGNVGMATRTLDAVIQWGGLILGGILAVITKDRLQQRSSDLRDTGVKVNGQSLKVDDPVKPSEGPDKRTLGV